MTDDELAALEALAKAATPGPWTWTGHTMQSPVDPPSDAYHEDGWLDDDEMTSAVRIIETDGGFYPPRTHDRAYIAAANPITVLALIAEIRELRAELEGC